MRKNMLRGAKQPVAFIDSLKDSWTATSHNVSLAGLTFQSGDICILTFATHSGGTRSGDPSGWTSITDLSGAGIDREIYQREMDGTETQIAFAGSSGTRIESAVVEVFRNAEAPTVTNLDSVTGTSVNPPAVPVTATLLGIVWVAAIDYANASGDNISASPSGYTDSQNVDQWNGTYGHLVRTAYKAEPAAAEDPGAFTASGLQTTAVAITMLIQAK